MATVALTGASGFVGRTLAATMSREGWHLKLLLRRSDAELEALGAEIVRGSLENEAALAALTEGAEAVVHVAGIVRAAQRQDFVTVNAAGTARLARIAAGQARRPRFLLISSLAAREPAISSYAASKQLAEAALLEMGSVLDSCIVRPPAVYGPGDRATLPLFRQLNRGLLCLPSRATGRFSLCYVSDLADAVVALLGEGEWGGRCFEPDDGRIRGYRWDDVAAIAGETLGRPIRRLAVPHGLLWGAAALAEGFAALTGRAGIFTPEKLREITHSDWVSRSERQLPAAIWSPRIDFAEGLARTLTWYKDKRWV